MLNRISKQPSLSGELKLIKVETFFLHQKEIKIFMLQIFLDKNIKEKDKGTHK